MRSREQIIEEYRQSDLQKRLHMFLDCPGLRREMIDIEQAKSTIADCAAEDPALSYGFKKTSFLSRIGRMCQFENCCRSNR
jgi:hypothetical protein